MRMAKTFTSDFNEEQLDAFEKELESGKFVPLCRQHTKKEMFGEFSTLETMTVGMIRTEMDQLYSIIYSLYRLMLVLPCTSVLLERGFSAMKFIKKHYR